MQLIPAIDIQNGACVRLLRGDFASTTVYAEDANAAVSRYAELGAPLLHIVDLDGAEAGRPVNTALIRQIADRCRVQCGGGLRDADGVAEALASGAERIVLGSLALTAPALTVELLRRFGPDRIVLALDVRGGEQGYRVCTHGWTVENAVTLEQALHDYVGHGLKHVLITDIDRDGALSGPNVELYRCTAAAFPTLEIQASGGVRNADDLNALAASGAAAAISGKALLENRISVEEMSPYLQSA